MISSIRKRALELFGRRSVDFVIFGQGVGFAEDRTHFDKKFSSFDWVDGLAQTLLENG